MRKAQEFRCGERNLSCARLPRTGAHLGCPGRKKFGCWSLAESKRKKQEGPCSHINSVTLWELDVCLGELLTVLVSGKHLCSLNLLFLKFSSWANFRCDISKQLPSFLLGDWGGRGMEERTWENLFGVEEVVSYSLGVVHQPSGIPLVRLWCGKE